jgi:prepilin-type N-terminal cleavage/methylation domain-containing protein/prepilin-type processing-associated H-X9-DG protein
MKRSRAAFTLVELLVVIAIIALLLSILMPALNKVRQQAMMAVCMANNRSVGHGTVTYMSDYGQQLPMSGQRQSNGTLAQYSWPYAPYADVRLLSYLGAKNVDPTIFGTDTLNTTVPVSPKYKNLKQFESVLKLFCCPAAKADGAGYVKQIYANGMYPESYQINADITGTVWKSDTFSGGWTVDTVNSYRKGTSAVLNISQPSATVLFAETRFWSVYAGVDTVTTFGVRYWHDVMPAHFIKTLSEPVTDIWRQYFPNQVSGRADLGFVDGHVANYPLKWGATNDPSHPDGYVGTPYAISGIKFTPNFNW